MELPSYFLNVSSQDSTAGSFSRVRATVTREGCATDIPKCDGRGKEVCIVETSEEASRELQNVTGPKWWYIVSAWYSSTVPSFPYHCPVVLSAGWLHDLEVHSGTGILTASSILSVYLAENNSPPLATGSRLHYKREMVHTSIEKWPKELLKYPTNISW